MKKFFSDFKAFALKGNIIDMAVGVVIGGAFGKIVSSLVADIISPLISLATGKVTLTDLKWVINPASHRCRRKHYPSRNCSHIRQFSSKHH